MNIYYVIIVIVIIVLALAWCFYTDFTDKFRFIKSEKQKCEKYIITIERRWKILPFIKPLQYRFRVIGNNLIWFTYPEHKSLSTKVEKAVYDLWEEHVEDKERQEKHGRKG